MDAPTITPTTAERTILYRELSQAAQEIRLLNDVLDAVTASTSINDVVQTLEYGIKNVLPATNWSNIELTLPDDAGQKMRTYQVTGEAGSRYWNNVRNGALGAGRDLGAHVRYVAGNAAEQIELLQQAIAAKVQGIAIAPIDATAAEPFIAKAQAAGIPVVVFDTPPPPNSAALAYIGTDNHLAGRLAGEALRRLLPGGGTVGVLLDSVSVENAMDRIMGAEEAIGDTTINLLPPQEAQFDPNQGRELARQTLREHPDLRGALGVCGSAGPGWGVVARDMKQDLKIVSFDLVADTIHLLQEGIVHAAIAQREYEMSYRSVELLCQAALDGPDAVLGMLPANHVIETGVDIVTLERTEWSAALADYLRGVQQHRPDPRLSERIGALSAPPSITVIGMAEVGEQGVVERVVRAEASAEVRQLIEGRQSQIINGTGAAKTRVLVPLLIHGTALGAICLESPVANACSPSELALLERVAGALAMVIENTRLFRQLERRAREIEQAYQRQEVMLQTISELSSPVVPVAPGILVVPMVGTIDTQRAAQFVETLLTAIGERHAQVVIIDITGVTVVDTSVANHILQAARAAQLLGAEVVVVGITPAVAQTVVQLGVQLPGIATRADLESGFAYALARTGGRVVYTKATR